jgi:hypothetical protein
LTIAGVEELQRTGRWDEAAELLAGEARALVAAGAELVVLCTNTMHKVADAISTAIDVPFVHIADTTAHAIREAGASTVGLLATVYTMEHDFYVGRLRHRHGLEVLVPGREDRRIVHRGHLRRALRRCRKRPFQTRVPLDHGRPGRAWRRGDPPRLHGDRPPRRSGRRAGARLRYHAAARREAVEMALEPLRTR